LKVKEQDRIFVKFSVTCSFLFGQIENKKSTGIVEKVQDYFCIFFIDLDNGKN